MNEKGNRTLQTFFPFSEEGTDDDGVAMENWDKAVKCLIRYEKKKLK